VADDHVYGFARAESEFIDGHGLDVHPSTCTTVSFSPGMRTS
jgi:hypothetical protein